MFRTQAISQNYRHGIRAFASRPSKVMGLQLPDIFEKFFEIAPRSVAFMGKFRQFTKSQAVNALEMCNYKIEPNWRNASIILVGPIQPGNVKAKSKGKRIWNEAQFLRYIKVTNSSRRI